MKNNIVFFVISIVCLTFDFGAIAQEQIVDRYGVVGGRGAETSRILIGDINNKTPILYYLSYNACPPNDIWMIHCIPWTNYPVEISEPAKVLIKTFENNVIELAVFNSENGITKQTNYLDNKPIERYRSGVHCKVSYEQLMNILKEGIYKIRIQTYIPNGFLEREYNNNDVAKSLKKAHDILIKELKPVDIYEGF